LRIEGWIRGRWLGLWGKEKKKRIQLRTDWIRAELFDARVPVVLWKALLAGEIGSKRQRQEIMRNPRLPE
jgi:hypothetical protein